MLTHLGYSEFYFSLHRLLSGIQVIFLSTKGFTMTDNNKPEWFEMAENDRPSIPGKPSKTLPIAAVLAAALILGVGAIVAQTQEETPAVADTSSAQSAAISDAATPATVTPTVSPAVTPAVTPKLSTTPSLQNPAIAQLPTKGGGDDGEYDDEGDGEHDDEGDDD